MANVITEPGLYDLDVADYMADPCPEPSLNNSLIGPLLRAPAVAKAQHPRLNGTFKPAESSNRLDFGSVCHKLLLGRGRDLAVLDFDDYRKNDAKDQRDAAHAAGKIPVLAKDHDRAQAMIMAARQQLTVDAFGPDIQTEVALIWRDTAGCWGRNLIDALDTRAAIWECWDYKTTDMSARPEDPQLGTHVVSMGYDTQCAMQLRGLTTVYPELGGRIKFRLMFQETEDPYLISIVEPSAATMTIAAKKVDYAFNRFAECLQRKSWPGYTPGVVMLHHADYLANRWLEREIAESGGEVYESAPKKRRGPKPGPRGPRKRILTPRTPLTEILP